MLKHHYIIVQTIDMKILYNKKLLKRKINSLKGGLVKPKRQSQVVDFVGLLMNNIRLSRKIR
jgi:hypothetical protein